jgi:hypothetical protein
MRGTKSGSIFDPELLKKIVTDSSGKNQKKTKKNRTWK